MPALLSLPNELLEDILNHLGWEFFRADVNRLCVCRRWYPLAQKVLLQTVVLYPINLVDYTGSASETLRSQLVKHTKDVRISLFHSSNDAPHHAQSIFGDQEDAFNFSDSSDFWQWTTRFRQDTTLQSALRDAVANMILSVSKFQMIEALRLRISDTRMNPHSSFFRGEYLYENLFFSLLYLSDSMPQNLTTLELSLDNEAFASAGASQAHFCLVIPRFLITVKNLAFHLETTCPDALKLPDDCGAIRLERLLINLDPKAISYRHQRGYWTGCQCDGSQQERFASLQKSQIVEAAKYLVQKMENPQMVRLLFGIGPHITNELVSIDCISGEEMKLRTGARLFEDGEVIEDAANRLSLYARYWDTTSVL